MLSALSASTVGDLTWFDGTTTTVRVQVHYDAKTMMRLSGTDAGADDNPACPVLGSGSITISTDDGRLSEDDFGRFSQFMGKSVPGGSPTFNATGQLLGVSAIRGSLTFPSSWQVSSSTDATFSVTMNAKVDRCSLWCVGDPTTADLAWSNPNSYCGYDGKIVAEVVAEPDSPCWGDATLATWRWR